MEQVATAKRARAGCGRRVQLCTEHHDQDGWRPPRGLVEPALQGPQRLHLYGPSRRPVWESRLRAVVPKRDLLGSGSVRKYLVSIALCLASAAGQPAPPPRVLLFFSLNVEADHMLFATDALKFFAEVRSEE